MTIQSITSKHTTDWRDSASCATSSMPDIWYPTTTTPHSPGWDLPRRICHACPVRPECLHEAMTSEPTRKRGRLTSRHGMRGGLTPDERDQLATTWTTP